MRTPRQKYNPIERNSRERRPLSEELRVLVTRDTKSRTTIYRRDEKQDSRAESNPPKKNKHEAPIRQKTENR